MANYAFASVEITGTKESVLAFADRFYCFDEQDGIRPGKFKGSYADYSHDDLTASIEAFFRTADPGCRRTFVLDACFAWSAEGCLFPSQEDKFISLATACAKDGVDVEVRSVEQSSGFEEYISGESSGAVHAETHDLQPFCCPVCHAEQLLASFEDPDDAECCECGHIGLDEQKEEVTENGT